MMMTAMSSSSICGAIMTSTNTISSSITKTERASNSHRARPGHAGLLDVGDKRMTANSTKTKGTIADFSIRGRIVFSLVAAAALIFAGFGWAARAQLAGAVIAHGEVIVRSQLKKIEHPDGGIVGEILVETGDTVEAGDVLIRLDATQIRAELSVVTSNLAVLEGRRARLIAVRDDAETIVFPDGFEAGPQTSAIAESEQRLFEHDRDMRSLRLEQLGLQIEQYEEEVDGLQAQLDATEAEQVIVAEDLDRMRELSGKNLVERARVTTGERELARINGTAGETTAGIARVKSRIGETRLRILELENQARTDAQQQLGEIDARLAELKERALAITDRLSRTDLRAPISGTVNDLAIHTINGVIAPGETVMSIVPEGELIIEARVPVTDVDQVAVGQAVKLRFSAFNQRTTPEVPGEVSVIGAAATVDPVDGVPYYLSHILIADAQDAMQVELVPGMPVEVFFQTEQRTALSYLAKPFTDQMQRAFRED
ncbi:HlyD family type I secretion periplasmic adaptor subunit [Maritimibacter sp. DP1N21-5]|uniref:HlyD family type I secretion periplasmic adaptor subunit n=1 Tax=Maritimibacter sp. DP1N21-5 TaxID=2836867 RepID=UPI001C45F8A8|nr:HlyD family type I secretion periplasmic adaptor subunit [Maritimibacter sp. DP1N21-5]MBV7409616.1 HlyD family type I secretion periplasmic adaptor subunit [Maritimibacter sp. DP1N21-5]